MAYKFQLGTFRASGSVIAEHGLTGSEGLSANDKDITNVKTIHLDAIKSDGTDIDIQCTNARTDAFALTVGGTVKLKLDTSNDALSLNTDVAVAQAGAFDLGASGAQFKDLYIDGKAYIDQLGEALDCDSQALTNVNVDSGTIDGVTIGTNSAVTDLRVDNIKIDANTISATNVGGSITLSPNGAGEVVANSAISGSGTLDIVGVARFGQGNAVTIAADGGITIGHMDANWTNAGRTIADLGTVSAATSITATDLIGTNIDGIVGADTARAGTFTAVIGTTGVYSGILKTDDTTEATSTTNGSLQTDGGLSVARSAVIGDDLDLLSDGAIINFGADKEISLTHVHESGLILAATGTAVPILEIKNTNNDATGGTLKFNMNGASPADNDVLGNIDFAGEDGASNVHTYARILAKSTDITGGDEQGSIEFYVAEYDGTVTKGMSIDGLASDGNIAVDISTHDGSAGGLKLGGTLVTATAAELNYVDIATLGTAATTKALTIKGDSTWTVAGMTCADLGTVTTIDINGGTVDGANIGASSQGTGQFSTLSASSTLNVAGAANFGHGNAAVIAADGGLTIDHFDANWTNASRTVADLGVVTTVDINGGSLDGTAIGAASQSTIKCSTLSGSGAATFGSTVVVEASVAAGTSFIIGNADLNETDLEKLDGITNGTAAANKCMVTDGSNDIASLRRVTATDRLILDGGSGGGVDMRIDSNNGKFKLINSDDEAIIQMDVSNKRGRIRVYDDGGTSIQTVIYNGEVSCSSGIQSGDGLTVDTGNINLKAATTASIVLASDHMYFKDDSNGQMKQALFSSYATAIAGDALGASAGVLAVSVDDSSIETNGDALRVKASGITNAMLAGSIANARLTNSSLTIGDSSISLGGTDTTLTGLTDIDCTAGSKTFFDTVGSGNSLTFGVAGSDFVVAGNLRVHGSSSVHHADNFIIQDPVIGMGYGTGSYTGSVGDRGILMGQSGENACMLLWNDGEDRFELGRTTGVPTDTDFTLASFSTLKVNSIIGDVAASVTSGSSGTALSTGINYFEDISVSISVNLPASPSAGDSVKVKCGSDVSDSVTLTVNVQGSHTVDGTTNATVLESPYAAVEFVYVTTNDWRLF